MKMQKKLIGYSIIMFLVIFLVLWIQELNGYILNIQAYFGLRLSLVSFWLLMTLIFVRVILSDSGFFKLGSAIGLLTCAIVLIVNFTIKDYQYEAVKSDQYQVVIEKVEVRSIIEFNIYQRDNFLFSRYVDKINAQTYYDITYELIDDRFVVTKCGVATCRSYEIVLE